MSVFKSTSSHEDHEIMNKINKLSHDQPEKFVRSPLTKLSSLQNHELRVKPQQESLQPSRRLIQLVNRDPVFEMAKRTLGLFPQVAYKLISGDRKRGLPGAGVDRVRLVTAFIISLFESEYFTVDKNGRYDASIPGNQERARNMLQGIIYGRKPIYLSYAGKYFFDQYPEMRTMLRDNQKATV